MQLSFPHWVRASLGGLVLALVLSGCAGIGMSSRPTPTPIALPAPAAGAGSAVRSYTLARGEIVNYAAYSGKAVLAVQEDLYFERSGRIAKVLASDGEFVEAGTLIAELDTEDTVRELLLAQMSLEIARQQLADAEESLAFDRRNADLALEIAELRLQNAEGEQVTILERQVDQAKIAVERLPQKVSPVLEINVERAQVGLNRVEESLNEARITAPRSGEVRFIKLSEAERQPAATAFEPVAQLVDADSLQIELNLTRIQLEPLREGMEVEIFLTGQATAPVRGRIETLPRPFGAGVGPLALISIQEPVANLRLYEGSTVDVRIELARKSDALLLPTEALYGFSGQYFVRVVEGGTQRAVDVEIGIQNAEYAEIVAGIDAGAEVIGRE